jgi:hypothetical protein
LTVRLLSSAASQLAGADIDASFGNYETVLDLPVGTYQVSEAGHPSWTLTVTITK